jgi:tRNA threonylcarbamoyladenosine biosynthesis protein TsaE
MPEQIELISKSVEDTIAFAQQCARDAKNGDIFTLSGPMGAGKSEFARAFIQQFVGENIDVPSPTFTLVQAYECDEGLIWHFDLYRLEDEDEIYEIGWEEALSDGILLIEWPERLGTLLPFQRIDIKITPKRQTKRKITLDIRGSANDR